MINLPIELSDKKDPQEFIDVVIYMSEFFQNEGQFKIYNLQFNYLEDVNEIELYFIYDSNGSQYIGTKDILLNQIYPIFYTMHEMIKREEQKGKIYEEIITKEPNKRKL